MNHAMPGSVIQGSEVHDFPLRGLLLDHQKHRAGLCHRLDDEESWHDHLAAGVVAEERLVESHVLQSADPDARFHLDDAVHEKKGIPMREELEKLVDVDPGSLHSYLLARIGGVGTTPS